MFDRHHAIGREAALHQIGGGRPCAARMVVVGHLRRLTPRKPACLSKRATRLQPTRTPAARRSR